MLCFSCLRFVRRVNGSLKQFDVNPRGGGDTAYDSGLVAVAGEDVNCLLRLGFVHCEHHSDTHVEDVEHLAVADVAVLLEETENRQDFPASLLYVDALALLEDARDILVETATGDVGDSVHITVADHVEDLPYIDAGRGQCHLAERLVSKLRIDLMDIEAGV